MTGVVQLTDMVVPCVFPLKKRLTEVCTQERKFHEQQGGWGDMLMEEGAIQLQDVSVTCLQHETATQFTQKSEKSSLSKKFSTLSN